MPRPPEIPPTDRSGRTFDAVAGRERRAGSIVARGQRASVAAILLSAALVVVRPPSATAADDASGGPSEPDAAAVHRLVSTCLDCHAIDDDSADRVGPTLQGVVGRRAAGVGDYDYSAGLYRRSAMGLVWDEDSLDRFLEAPQSVVPGIAMIYAGLPDPDDRARVIAWLASGPEPVAADAPSADASRHGPGIEAVLGVEADVEYGEYLAGNCLTCHSGAGASGSVPPIVGLPADYFVGALLDYRRGERSSAVMRTMSEPLGTKELAALAAYFARPAN